MNSEKLNYRVFLSQEEYPSQRKSKGQVWMMADRRDYKSGSIYFDEKRNMFVAEVSYQDPATGARKYRRKSAGANKAGKAPQELKDWLDEMRGKKRSGIDLDEKSVTVKEWLDVWLTIHKPNLRSKTRESYDGIIRLRIVPALGAVKLKSLTQTAIQKFVNDLRGRYNPRGVQYSMTIFKQALSCAVENGLLQNSPARNVKTAAKIDHEINPPAVEEVGVFLEAAKKTRFYMYFLLLAVTGMRRAEALALRWSDVDLKAGGVNVQRTMVYTKAGGIEFNDPKTKSGRRRILIPLDIVGELKTHRKELLKLKMLNADVWEENNLCFPVQTGGPQDPHNMDNAFRRIMKAAGLGEWHLNEKVLDKDGKPTKDFKAKFRMHDLRHAHATDLMQAGWSARAVQERLGHFNVTVTLSIYSHVREEMQKDLSASLQGVYTKTKEQKATSENK